MFLVGLISWWYGRGWVAQWRRVLERLSSTVEFFSIGQLLSTLFSPFRQISAMSSSDGSIGAEFRAFIDQLISRVIGAFVRFFTILFGIVVIIAQSVYELIMLVGWWLLPLLPVVGAVVFAIGWVPSWT